MEKHYTKRVVFFSLLLLGYFAAHVQGNGDRSGGRQLANKTAAEGKSGGEQTVVRGLDVARYMGRWYEMASLPSIFEPRDARDTRATYSLLADGATVRVFNEAWSKGKRVYIVGTAVKADPNSDEAKLKVKFHLPRFLPIVPVVGDYWVLYVDGDYQYALVGEPRRKNLYILCRKTTMGEDVYNQLVQRAKDQGYDVSKLHRTPQDDPPPESKSLFGK